MRIRAISPFLLAAAGLAAQPTVHLNFLAENDSARAWSGVAWIDSKDLESPIPGFDGFSFVVTTTNTSSVTGDLKERRAFELPSQAVDEDLDGRPDRIAVHLSLQAGEKKLIALHAGPAGRMLRLQGRPARACTAARILGGEFAVWESESAAYFFQRSTGSVFGLPKLSIRPVLTQMPVTRACRPNEAEFPAIEVFGGDGPEIAPPEVIAEGPVAGGIRVGAPTSGTTFLVSSGDWWTWVEAAVQPGKKGATVALRLPKRPDEKALLGQGWVATIGGAPLLLQAVFVPEPYRHSGEPPAKERPDATRHTLWLKPDREGRVRYALAVRSALEHFENVVEPGETPVRLPVMGSAERFGTTARMLLRPARLDAGGMERWVREDILRLHHPPRLTRLSSQAGTYTAVYPPEMLRPGRKKNYDEALRLMLARLRSLTEQGKGQFWFSSNPAGEPKFIAPKRSWGDGYLISMLWDGFRVTGDEWFRSAALAANESILGGEEFQAHATGLNYWDGSARTYRETRDPRWRASGVKCADMMARIADPVTGLIPEYGRAARREPDNPYHPSNYVKIDALVGVPILWWAWEETSDRRYLDAANRHLASTIDMLIEPDGAVIQQLWLKPGTKEVLGAGTSQGFGGTTRWARGVAWVLDGFPDAYRATKDPRYRAVFERTARWLEANLPEDSIPWYDFDDQGTFWRYRDSSTAAISAYGLLRMSGHEPDAALARYYRALGLRLVDALIDRCLTPVGAGDPRPAGMLAHATYTKPVEGEFIWGNYSLLRSLCWLRDNQVNRQ